MKRVVLICTLLCAALIAGAAASDPGDETVANDPALPEAEYITGVPIPPNPEARPAQKDPFKPYDVGEGVSPIPYEALTAEERAVVERGRNVAGWQQVHNAYGAAASELGARARSEAAARQLGVDDLATQGVVP